MKLEELERLILLEANKGDIAEGLFSLGLSLLLADPSGELFKKEFDNRKIIPIDCSELIWGFGAIHCLTQQEPK